MTIEATTCMTQFEHIGMKCEAIYIKIDFIWLKGGKFHEI